MRFLRARQLGDTFLRHSELSRSIGLPSTVALGTILSFPLLVFVLLPISISSVAGPSILISLLIAYLIVFLTVSHTAELSCAVPKNCVQYHFGFAILGELPAFFMAWIQLLDCLSISHMLAKAWSSHFNLLFRRLIYPVTSFSLLHKNEETWVLSTDFDALAVIATAFTLILLCCSLKVVGTVSICFLCVTVLIVSSCTMVAFFHADPQNWIDANFFTFGIPGVLRGVCLMLVAFCGVEQATFTMEETKNPRTRLSTVLPYLTSVFGIAFFIVILIFSMSINVTKLKPDSLLPELFTLLNIPAARYMLTVASVCGLSGALLSSFIPGSRILSALSKDGLLPLPADVSPHSPICSLFAYSLLVCVSLLVKTDIIFELVTVTTPLRILITVVLTYLQHYRPEPIGIPHETTNYKCLSKRRLPLSVPDSLASAVLHDSQYSMDTAVFVQMNVAQMETERLQNRLENEVNERMPLTTSVSHYNSMNKKCETGLASINHGHNCIAEPCSPTEHRDGPVHLYHREIPEIPFCANLVDQHRSSTPGNMKFEYRKAQFLLFLFVVSTTSFSLILVRTEYTISCIVLCALFMFISVTSVVLIARLPTNDYMFRRQSKTPLFPFISLFVIFLVLLCFVTFPVTVLLPFTAYMIIGVLIYFGYGIWCSVERNVRVGQQSLEEQDDAYRAIMGDDITSI